MNIEVEVFGENPKSGHRIRCTKAEMTMVAMGSDGKPTEVPSFP